MLQELLNLKIDPIGSTHYDACRPSSMNGQPSVTCTPSTKYRDTCVRGWTCTLQELSDTRVQFGRQGIDIRSYPVFPCFRNTRICKCFEGETVEFCRG